ncbi:hypothetical protein EDB92DRAFT_2056297 [Lactarius akahatsu]|uniref:C2H2-type domain-containing protein n=1 Tax=Lactarius akahatsu TaxID=416441 RepID=A0AAD4L8B8_9AGAM|nr:hypothetical protein EDB92DRAFT_2056297 [Lactarius akahatsu]
MVYCDRCERWFPHDRALEQHKEDSDSHWACDDCDLDFGNHDALRQHYIQSQNHHYCKECDRHFKFDESRRQHMDDKHWYCREHDRVFKSEPGLHSHYRQSTDHHYCFECEEDFDDEDELWDHLVDDHNACRDCHDLFDSYSELQKHDHEVHDYCTECARVFQNQHSLQQHLNSKLHRPSTIACPGRKCKKSFISPAALTLHFESGACRSGMTREQLNRLVVRADRNNYITNPARLIGGPPGGYEPPMTTSAWATELSWNGMEYECFLCHSTFKTIDRLNQHLKSPAHDQKIYRCPKPDCRVEFVALSALCQHVEGGSCGVRMFRQVQNAMESLTRGFNAISI